MRRRTTTIDGISTRPVRRRKYDRFHSDKRLRLQKRKYEDSVVPNEQLDKRNSVVEAEYWSESTIQGEVMSQSTNTHEIALSDPRHLSVTEKTFSMVQINRSQAVYFAIVIIFCLSLIISVQGYVHNRRVIRSQDTLSAQ